MLNTMGAIRSQVECRGCTERLYEFDSCFVCAEEMCERNAVPVDAQGRTAEEAFAEQADGSSDLRLVPEVEAVEEEDGEVSQADPSHFYSSEAMDAARRIGH